MSTKKAATDQQAATPAPHPGIVLRDEYMKPAGLNPHKLSLELRITVNRIGEVIHGRRAISPDTALRLARFFCTTPEYWLDLQQKYELDKARAEAGETIANDVRDGCQGKTPRK